MYIKHFESISSTQDYLKENFHHLLEHDKNILVSTSHQTNGHGRHNKRWITPPGNLAFSLTLKAADVKTLSTIEIAIIIRNFLLQKFSFEIDIKWPNDLIYHCLLYTSPSPRDQRGSRMPSSA